MFEDQIIYKSMYNDIYWDKKHNETVCVANSHMVPDHAEEFQNVTALSSDPVANKRGTERTLMVNGIRLPNELWLFQ